MANREIPTVSIITVTYNSSHVVEEMLDSLSGYNNAEVILVDNGSSDIQKIQTLADQYGARLISNKENKGFGSACNQGAKMATFDLLLFLNPDTIISEIALNTLLYSTIKYPNASAFNPAMYDSKGNQSFKRSSKLCPGSNIISKGWPSTDREVPVLSGAALLVRKSAFIDVGGFDEEIFLYFEDDDLSMRLKSMYGPLMFIKDAKLLHKGGSSSSNSIHNTYFKSMHWAQSQIYTSRKHGISFATMKALIPAVLKICFLPRLFSAQKRAKSFGYIRGIFLANSHILKLF